MTRKQINSLRRKARMGAVIGAAIYLAVGVTSFGKGNSSIEASATPTQQPVSIPQETSKATVQEERIITYTYDTVDASWKESTAVHGIHCKCGVSIATVKTV